MAKKSLQFEPVGDCVSYDFSSLLIILIIHSLNEDVTSDIGVCREECWQIYHVRG